jgi:hypothetical protein
MTNQADKVAIYISRGARDAIADSRSPSSFLCQMAVFGEAIDAARESKASEQTYDVTVKGLTLGQLRGKAYCYESGWTIPVPTNVSVFADYLRACRAKLAEIEGRKP